MCLSFVFFSSLALFSVKRAYRTGVGKNPLQITFNERMEVCLMSQSNLFFCWTSGLHTLSALYCIYPPIQKHRGCYFYFLLFSFVNLLNVHVCISLTDLIEIRKGRRRAFPAFRRIVLEGDAADSAIVFGARC